MDLTGEEIQAHQRRDHENVIQEKAGAIDLSRDDPEAHSEGRQDKCKAGRGNDHMSQVVMVIASLGLRHRRHVDASMSVLLSLESS